jgi:hypothetical protein
MAALINSRPEGPADGKILRPLLAGRFLGALRLLLRPPECFAAIELLVFTKIGACPSSLFAWGP